MPDTPPQPTPGKNPKESENNEETSSATVPDRPNLPKEFAGPLEEMKELMSQSSRSFLIGAGCSKCAGLPLMEELTEKVLGSLSGDVQTKSILEGLKENFQKANTATIEDLMSELVDWISIAQRRQLRFAKEESIIIGNKKYNSDNLLDALKKIKSCIAKHIQEVELKTDFHQLFVKSVHSVLQSGKTMPSQEVDYFILNYDTLLEDALGLEKVRHLDGFNGGATGWWSAECYENREIFVRVFKIHGSIDWCLLGGDVLPRRIRPGLPTNPDSDSVLIWPAATKYRETQRDPFAQIILEMRKSLRPADRSQTVLTICGYSFGDHHINIEIERALYESGENLTVLAFTNEDQPTGVLEQWVSSEVIRDQILVFANGGFFHGTKEIRSDTDLPWWKFEVLARLLGGER